MKNIYQIVAAEGFDFCHPVNVDGFDAITQKVNGLPRKAEWKPIRMQIIREEQGRRLQESDSPWLGAHALIFRPKAASALSPLLREYGELLPLDCKGAQVTIFNVTRVIDALDERASKLTRFRDGSVIMIMKYVFREDQIGDVVSLSWPV